MRKDKKTVESICLVTRHLQVPKYNMVFDYNSRGDLFYMVLHGKIDCKVPIPKQVVYLSKEEYNVFVEEFRDDLISIKEESALNNNLRNRKKAKELTNFKNPYDLPKRELVYYLQDIRKK